VGRVGHSCVVEHLPAWRKHRSAFLAVVVVPAMSWLITRLIFGAPADERKAGSIVGRFPIPRQAFHDLARRASRSRIRIRPVIFSHWRIRAQDRNPLFPGSSRAHFHSNPSVLASSVAVASIAFSLSTRLGNVATHRSRSH
jgi:hypothetical protein